MIDDDLLLMKNNKSGLSPMNLTTAVYYIIILFVIVGSSTVFFLFNNSPPDSAESTTSYVFGIIALLSIYFNICKRNIFDNKLHINILEDYSILKIIIFFAMLILPILIIIFSMLYSYYKKKVDYLTNEINVNMTAPVGTGSGPSSETPLLKVVIAEDASTFYYRYLDNNVYNFPAKLGILYTKDQVVLFNPLEGKLLSTTSVNNLKQSQILEPDYSYIPITSPGPIVPSGSPGSPGPTIPIMSTVQDLRNALKEEQSNMNTMLGITFVSTFLLMCSALFLSNEIFSEGYSITTSIFYVTIFVLVSMFFYMYKTGQDETVKKTDLLMNTESVSKFIQDDIIKRYDCSRTMSIADAVAGTIIAILGIIIARILWRMSTSPREQLTGVSWISKFFPRSAKVSAT
jgi:hypothetical protein